MVQEIQKTREAATNNIINGFVQDLRANFQNNNLITQELQRNWTVIQGALNALSQQGQGQNLGLNAIDNLIRSIQRRVADSEATGTVDLTPELPELSRMVYHITNLLESRSRWDPQSHDTNIVAVFRAILYEAYSRERGSQIQAIQAGLRDLENNGLPQNVTNDRQTILNLISSSQNNNNPPIVIDPTERSELNQLRGQRPGQRRRLVQLRQSILQNIISTLNTDPNLRDTYRRVVARIVVGLETNRNWNQGAREGNLKAVAQVLAYMIAMNDLSTP
jgi:hypothetical protein